MAGKEVSDYEFRTKDSTGAPIELLMSLPVQRKYPIHPYAHDKHACTRWWSSTSDASIPCFDCFAFVHVCVHAYACRWFSYEPLINLLFVRAPAGALV